MERNGWLLSRAIGPGTKARKNYTLTREGNELLKLLRARVEELFEEVCEETCRAQPGAAQRSGSAGKGPSNALKPRRRNTVGGSPDRSRTATKARAR